MNMQNQQVEGAIVASILVDAIYNPHEPSALDKVGDILLPKDFTHHVYRELFVILLDRHKNDLPNDPVSLLAEERIFKIPNFLKPATSLIAMCERITDSIGTTANVEHHTEILINLTQKRAITRLGSIMIETAEEEDFDATLKEAQDRIEIIRSQRQIRDPYEGWTKAIAGLEAKFKGGDEFRIFTGFDGLDKYVQIERGNLIIVGGRASMGKTSFGLDLAYNMSRKHRVLFYSLEMSEYSVRERLISAESGLSISQLAVEDNFDTVSQSMAPLTNLQLEILSPKSNDVDVLRSHLSVDTPSIVIIDYLTLMTCSRRDSRQQEVEYIVNQLKEIARSMNIVVIALAQISRKAEDRSSAKPLMSDLRDSGAIEQAGDVILLLYRPEYYQIEGHDDGYTECLIAKNRQGPTGMVELTFNKSLTTFRNVDQKDKQYREDWNA